MRRISSANTYATCCFIYCHLSLERLILVGNLGLQTEMTFVISKFNSTVEFNKVNSSAEI